VRVRLRQRPPQFGKQPHSGLFDKLVFGVGVGHVRFSSLLKANAFEQIGHLHESVRLNLLWRHLTKRSRLFQE
jgi:hypothetical protein